MSIPTTILVMWIFIGAIAAGELDTIWYSISRKQRILLCVVCGPLIWIVSLAWLLWRALDDKPPSPPSHP